MSKIKPEESVARMLGAARSDDKSIAITRVTWGRRKPVAAQQIEKYLETLAETGRVKASCEAAGIDYKTIYFLRHDNELFALAEKQAREAGAEALEQVALEQAVLGLEKGVWHQGQLVGTERYIPSNPLLQFLLKAQNPDRFMDRSERINRPGDAAPPRVTNEDDRRKLIELLEKRVAQRVTHKPDDGSDLL